LADAGREARQASTVVVREIIDQLTATVGAATGEVVRAAVVGAVAAIIRSAPKTVLSTVPPLPDSWDDLDYFEIDHGETTPAGQLGPHAPPQSGTPNRPGWVNGMRAVGTALTVAAGGAAAVPGGRLVAAGLGAFAAVAGLAARASEVLPSE
jgi:hypothetical protein